MTCTQCRSTTNKLTGIFADSGARVHPSERLCDECLVGFTVPIYRPHLHQWHVGEIDEYDRKTGMHHFIFPDSEEEWLKVEPNPFISYLNHFKSQSRLALHDNTTSRHETKPNHPLTILPNSLTELPSRLNVDDRDDISSFDAGYVKKNNHIDRMFHAPAWRLGRDKKPPVLLDEAASAVPESIWVEQPRMSHEGSVSMVGPRHHWTWPSFGLIGGTSRVHPGLVPPPPNGVATSYHRAGDDFHINRNTEVVVDTTPRKTCPRFWTVEEDNLLLAALDDSTASVQQQQQPVKWPTIAKWIPGRTGKQCRERYLNHLKPRVKLNRWTAVEDSAAFLLFQSMGSKWAMISKFIPGRTDNGVKNRVHFLKRRLDQHVVHVAMGNDNGNTTTTVTTNSSSINSIGDAPSCRPSDNGESFKNEEQCEISRKVLVLLHHLEDSVVQGDFRSMMSEYSFGPFRSLEGQTQAPPMSCLRCRLMMPSAQTGRSYCETTGWCLTCTTLPTYLSGYALGEFLMMMTTTSSERVVDETR